MKTFKKIFATTILAFVMAVVTGVMPVAANPVKNTAKNIDDAAQYDKTIKKIRKELVTLPFYSVFDNLSFKFEDGKVTLFGQVSRPSLRGDAKRVVAKVTGVEEVENKIEVLPLSNFDDRIRLATFRAIYRQPGLDRLSLQAVPPIHIIVKNGNVTLEGVVLSKSDATRAFIAANGVFGVFSVTNNLRVEKD